MSGFSEPSIDEGPMLENQASASVVSVAPTPMDSG